MILRGLIGYKNAGKTTLTEKLVVYLTARGLTVSTLKRTHHALDLETKGTDSHRHRMAGASQVILASDHRLTLMEEVEAPSLLHLTTRLDPCDIVLAEGWKSGSHIRIEAWRPETGRPPLATTDKTIRAVASTAPCDVACPVLDLDDVAAIAKVLLA